MFLCPMNSCNLMGIPAFMDTKKKLNSTSYINSNDLKLGYTAQDNISNRCHLSLAIHMVPTSQGMDLFLTVRLPDLETWTSLHCPGPT